MRIGFGYDVHKLVPDRKLILGGVEIPYELGLLGHSDADVLVHAVMDSLLGAAALGSIGDHFPDTDKLFKDISSMALLSEVKKLLDTNKKTVVNIDSVIAAQEPKLAGYIKEMCYNISSTLDIPEGQVSVKATTTEELGFVGNKEGIAAYSVCLLETMDHKSV
ncbi:MAG: 2-C-methyl-D-erythritol 2,4-cyclodiphosphate synthase [Candidatus Margulisiibacteriota bacterium]